MLLMEKAHVFNIKVTLVFNKAVNKSCELDMFEWCLQKE